MNHPANGDYRGFRTIMGNLSELIPEEGTPAIWYEDGLNQGKWINVSFDENGEIL